LLGFPLSSVSGTATWRADDLTEVARRENGTTVAMTAKAAKAFLRMIFDITVSNNRTQR
jgi:hypothetical protein